MKYEACVFIGRFQPIHEAHIQIIEQALQIADKVIVSVGSAHRPKTIKNPWTAEERISMISKLSDEANRRLLNIFESVLKISPYEATRMNDSVAYALFLKLDFQHRQNCGMFERYGMYTDERNDLDYIRNEIVDLELLS